MTDETDEAARNVEARAAAASGGQKRALVIYNAGTNATLARKDVTNWDDAKVAVLEDALRGQIERGSWGKDAHLRDTADDPGGAGGMGRVL